MWLETEQNGRLCIKWIALYFNDCVYDNWEVAGFALGMLSLMLFAVSFVPQIWNTFIRKDVTGVSFTFLAIWVLGDVANMLGAFLTQQVAAVKYTGVLFTLVGIVLLLQYIYYKRYYTKMVYSEVNVDYPEEDSIIDVDNYPELFQSLHSTAATASIASIILPVAEASLGIVQDPSIVIVGETCAWLAGILYFTSRIPQIIMNYKFRDVEGLSIMLFCLTILANLTYGLQIIMRVSELDAKFFTSTFPYLIGSLGTMAFDIVILFQAVAYGSHRNWLVRYLHCIFYEDDETLVLL